MDGYDIDPQILWGIALDEDLPAVRSASGPMTPEVADYLRFFCEEMGLHFDPTFTQRQAALVIGSFLQDPATKRQLQTMEGLGAAVDDGLTYGTARTKIRRLVALRGLRSA